jgi:hypothetical protein
MLVRRTIALSVVACLLLLSGLVYPQLAAHAAHHSHHQAASHATVLCSWMCAAGQAADDVAFFLDTEGQVLGLALERVPRLGPSPSIIPFPSRGPPAR